jgi:inorganic pyrophosphatase
MDDDGEKDDKVIAVPTEDPRYDHVRDVDDLTDQQRAEIAEFFETYKNLETGKRTETLGFEGREAAFEAVEHAMDLYEETYA